MIDIFLKLVKDICLFYNRMSSTNIYILQLEKGKYYVGKSNDPLKRFQDHVTGTGSLWTKIYKPLMNAPIQIYPNVSHFDEDKFVKQYMAKYGIGNVRGGTYVTEQLDDNTVYFITKEIWSALDLCSRCGRENHFVSECYAKTDIDGNELQDVK